MGSNEPNEDNARHTIREYWQAYNEQEASENQKSSQATSVVTQKSRSTQPWELGERQKLTDQEKSIINHAPGRSEPNQSARLATQDKVWYTGRFCEYLELPPQQKKEAQRLMAQLDLDKFGNQKRIEKIALVVIRYIVERDQNMGAEEYWRITSYAPYMDLMEKYGMNKGDLMRLSPKVKEEIQILQSDDL